MSYYDGDHPYLAEQRRLDEEEEQRKREQNEAWEQNQRRMSEEWDRQLAKDRASRSNNRNNDYSEDNSCHCTNYDGDSSGYSSTHNSGYSVSSSNGTGIFGYIAIFIARVIAVFIWLFFCEVVLDLPSNYVAFWIVLIPALIIEYKFGNSSNYIHMMIEILGYLFIFSQYVQYKQGFIQLYSMLPLASYFAGFFINKK